MLAFKFVNGEYKSPEYLPKINYSGPWPKVVVNNRGGISVSPYRANMDWTGIWLDEKIIMLEVDKSDIIVSEENGIIKVTKAVILREATEEEKYFIRAEACRDAYCALYYACDVDQCARDDTREAAYKDGNAKYFYQKQIEENLFCQAG